MKILLVEDDFDVRETIAEVLVDGGHDVTFAGDGAQGLALLRGGLRPDVILLDLMMAGMSGIEFRQHQRADAALEAIPVVICTADRSIVERATELGVAAYLKKPMQLDDLLEVLAKFA